MASNDVGGIKRKVLNTEYAKLEAALNTIETNLNQMYTNLSNLNRTAWHGGSRADTVYKNIAANYQNNVTKTKTLEEMMVQLKKYKNRLNAKAKYNSQFEVKN